MSEGYREIIYNGLNQKSTEELIEIWITNDQAAWTETAFEVVQELLLERLGELPERPPEIENESEEEEEQTYAAEFARLLKLTSQKEKKPQEDNQPVFYAPIQVLWLDKWLPRAAIALIVLTVIGSISIVGMVQKLYLSSNPSTPTTIVMSWVVAFIVFFISMVTTAIIYYFPLRALGLILKILMEMEFNSRSAKP